MGLLVITYKLKMEFILKMDHSLTMHHYKFLFQSCKFSMSFFMLLQFVTDFFPTLNRFTFKIKMHKSQ